MLGGPPSRDLRTKRLFVRKCPFIFLKCAKIVTNHNYQTYLQLMESGYSNSSPRYVSIISSGCAKTKLGLSRKRTKSAGNTFVCLMFEFWLAYCSI